MITALKSANGARLVSDDVSPLVYDIRGLCWLLDMKSFEHNDCGGNSSLAILQHPGTGVSISELLEVGRQDYLRISQFIALGTRYAVRRKILRGSRTEYYLVDLQNSTEKSVIKPPKEKGFFRFSPDGKQVFYGSGSAFHAVDTRSGALRLLFDAPLFGGNPRASRIAITNKFLVLSWGPDLAVIDSSTGFFLAYEREFLGNKPINYLVIDRGRLIVTSRYSNHLKPERTVSVVDLKLMKNLVSEDRGGLQAAGKTLRQAFRQADQ